MINSKFYVYRTLFVLVFISAFLINFIGKVLLLTSILFYFSYLIFHKKKILYGDAILNVLLILHLTLSSLHIALFKEFSIDYLTPILYFFLLPDLSKRVGSVWLRNSLFLKAVFYVFILFGIIRFLKIGIDLNQLNFYFLNKNTASMLFELIAGFILLNNRKKIFYLISLIGLLLIGGKTSILMFLIYGILLFNPWIIQKKLTYLIAIFFSIYATYYIYNFIPIELIKTLFYRFSIWEQAIQEIYNNPFVGNGINSFHYATKEFGLFGKEAIHNYYLQQIHSFGLILGLIPILIIAYTTYLTRSIESILFLMIFILHAFIDVGWVYGPGILYGLFLGNLKSSK